MDKAERKGLVQIKNITMDKDLMNSKFEFYRPRAVRSIRTVGGGG